MKDGLFDSDALHPPLHIWLHAACGLQMWGALLQVAGRAGEADALAGKPAVMQRVVLGGGKAATRSPLAVLLNGQSASASEILAGTKRTVLCLLHRKSSLDSKRSMPKDQMCLSACVSVKRSSPCWPLRVIHHLHTLLCCINAANVLNSIIRKRCRSASEALQAVPSVVQSSADMLNRRV